MDQNFDIQSYMTRGVERVVSDAIKATLKNPRESAFMLKFAAASKAASKRRAELEKTGRARSAIFVEFVPVTEESKEFAPGEEERDYLTNEIARLRVQYPEMVFVSFPGDEKSSGGCLAAG